MTLNNRSNQSLRARPLEKLPVRLLVIACVLLYSIQAFGQTQDRFEAQTSVGGSDEITSLEQVPRNGRDALKTANLVQEELRRGQAALLQKMEDARKNKNIEMLNCLNEKYTKLGALLEVVTTASIVMEESIEQNKPDAIEREYKKIVLVHDYAKQLLESAEDCNDTSGYALDNEDVVREVLEGDLGREEIQGPIETVLDPDLGMIPCW